MKKLFKICFAVLLSATFLTGCGDSTTDYADPSLTCLFHFYDKKGNTEIEIGEFETRAIINLTKEQFVDQYLNGSLENRYPNYSYVNMTYSTGNSSYSNYIPQLYYLSCHKIRLRQKPED